MGAGGLGAGIPAAPPPGSFSFSAGDGLGSGCGFGFGAGGAVFGCGSSDAADALLAAAPSAAFAARITRELGEEAGVPAQVERAYQLALGRKPSVTEAAECEPVVRDHGLPVLCRVLFNSNEFLFMP